MLLGEIKKGDNYYYIPKYEVVNGIENDNKPTYRSVIEKKYISNGVDIYGCYAGKTLEKRLNVIEQEPAIEEIVTNNTTRRIKEKIIEKNKVILRRPYMKITKDNCKEYELLQLLTDIDKEVLVKRKDRVKTYIKKSKLSLEKAKRISKNFPMKTRKRLKELEL